MVAGVALLAVPGCQEFALGFFTDSFFMLFLDDEEGAPKTPDTSAPKIIRVKYTSTPKIIRV
ncbi:hypothetical protein [Methanobacterium petrolearium]|uniref:hypothetical protein n=1 Tax=Methanobacterium petrolearium TaxID=710190 RepID=UPI003081CFDD